MPKKRLTDAGVRKLKPRRDSNGEIIKEQRTFYDEGQAGLILNLNWGGSKSWRVLFYQNRKTHSHALGSFPEMGVKAAREAAGAFKANLKAFLADKSKPPPIPLETFKAVSERYIKREVEGKKLSESQIVAIIKAVNATWADRPFEELRRSDVTKLLDDITDTRGPRAADISLAVIRKIMNWYTLGHDDYQSPIVKGMARLKPKERARKRVLTDDELRALFKACDDLGTFGNMTKMLIYTAQRRSMVSTMRFDDIVDGVWNMPQPEEGAPKGKGNGKRLKLSPAALAIVKKQGKVQTNEFVFAASRVGRRDGPGEHFGSFSAFGQGKAELDALMAQSIPDIPQWQLHDCRRTARTLLQRAGVSSEHAESILGHEPAGVESVYARYEFFDEKGIALAKLDDLISMILKNAPVGGNVVSIKGKGR